MANTTPTMLNLGSGPRATPGWVCIDRSPNLWLSKAPRAKRALRALGVLSDGHMADWDSEIVRSDIRRLKYPEASVDAVYSSHALEHMYLDDARRVLADAYRVLKPGGILRLALPDATAHAKRLVDGEAMNDPNAGKQFNMRMLTYPERKQRGLRALVGRAGGHIHYWQPSPSMVIQMLEQAGFRDVALCAYHQGALPDLRSIETRPEGFHVEAQK